MKFKFAPKGDYKPEQLIEIAGSSYRIESVERSGKNLIAVGITRPERILVVLTDEQPIQEITSESTAENTFERPKN